MHSSNPVQLQIRDGDAVYVGIFRPIGRVVSQSDTHLIVETLAEFVRVNFTLPLRRVEKVTAGRIQTDITFDEFKQKVQNLPIVVVDFSGDGDTIKLDFDTVLPYQDPHSDEVSGHGGLFGIECEDWLFEHDGSSE